MKISSIIAALALALTPTAAGENAQSGEEESPFSVPVSVTLEARDGFTGNPLPAAVLPSELGFYFTASCPGYSVTGILDSRFTAYLGDDGRYHTDGDLSLGSQTWDIISKVQEKCASYGEFTLGVRGDFPQPIRSDSAPFYFGRTSQRENTNAVVSLTSPEPANVGEAVLYGYDRVSVTPEEPSIKIQQSCDPPSFGYELILPEVAGVVYSKELNGNALSVTASPASSYYTLRGTTAWTFDVTPEVCPEPEPEPEPEETPQSGEEPPQSGETSQSGEEEPSPEPTPDETTPEEPQSGETSEEDSTPAPGESSPAPEQTTSAGTTPKSSGTSELKKTGAPILSVAVIGALLAGGGIALMRIRRN